MTQRLDIGEYGKITCYEQSNGDVQARGRYRGPDGRRHDLKATGPSERLAIKAFKKEVELACSTSAAGNDALTRRTTVEGLAELWMAEKARSGLRPQSIANYTSVLNSQVLPRMRAWRVDEMTAPRLDSMLARIHEEGLSTTHIRKVLSGMCRFAVIRGALPSNPVRDVTPHRKSDVEKAVGEVRPFDSPYDVEAVFALVEAAMDRQRGKPGPNPTNDLPDFLLLLAGTGVRPGEGLCLAWPDFNLLAEQPYVDVTATLVFLKGRGWHRQSVPKTDASRRRLYLPSSVVAMLLRRQIEQDANPHNAVFPARNGAWPSQTKYGLRFREALAGTAYDWATFKTFRKTVATEMKRSYGSQAAASQLGHADDSITDRYYVPAEHAGPHEAADVLGSSVLCARGRPSGGTRVE